MLTNGAKRSRRCGGTDTRATQTPLCSDRPAAAALAARTRAPARLAAIRDASRPPASHLNRDADGGSLQHFYLKEKKKNYPTTQRTKPIMNRNSGSLCLLSVLCGGLPELSLPHSPSAMNFYLIPTRTSGPVSPALHHASWSFSELVLLWLKGWGVSLGPLPLEYHRPLHQGAVHTSARGGLWSLQGGMVLGFCPCAPFLTSLVHGPSSVSWAPCFPPQVALAAGFPWSSCLRVLHMLCLPGRFPVLRSRTGCRVTYIGGTSQAWIHHPSEQCCPPGLKPGLCLFGSRSG